VILDLNFTFKNHTETKSNELRCRFKITEQIKTIYSMKFIIVIQSNLVFFLIMINRFHGKLGCQRLFYVKKSILYFITGRMVIEFSTTIFFYLFLKNGQSEHGNQFFRVLIGRFLCTKVL
jgi:hypothetical protein